MDPSFSSHVCRLHKSLYGLKQALRAWFECFTTHLLTLGLIAYSADSSLFVRCVRSSLTYLLLYMDDIFVMGPDASYISVLKHELRDRFKISDVGNLIYFFCLEIQHVASSIYVDYTIVKTH